MNKTQKMSKQLGKDFSDKQALRKKQSSNFNQEFSSEPLTTTEKLNNKKTKKRQ
ncbi:small acid-soluble spore protein O [Rummeliibacillus sp. JY-2-4R]